MNTCYGLDPAGRNNTLIEAILPKGTRLYQLTRDRAIDLWDKLRKYDALWPDETRGDVVAWVEWCLRPSTQFIEADGGEAMFILSHIVEGLSANIHAIFYDHRVLPRVPLMRDLILWAMFEFDLYRLEARIPEFSHTLKRVLKRDLGFKLEGVLRNTFRFKGDLCNSVILSILREEVV